MSRKADEAKPASDAVAIIGMSCIFPGAANLEQYWRNICDGTDSIREPGDAEWNGDFYRSKSSERFGRIYCTKGGFISEFANFNPLEFGIMPSSLRGSDPDQFLALRAAAEALADAGYQHKSFEVERAEIIIGRTMAPGVGSLNLIQHGQTVDQVLAILAVLNPELDLPRRQKIAEELGSALQPCNADTIPAVMPNVLAGRIAAKLGFRGRNLVLDAACASSLIAVEIAMQGLLSGQSELAIAGGVHINSSPYFYQMFSELGALSNSNSIRPFDNDADGTILGEGVGMLVLKRLEDARQDGDRVYAVIRGIGSSSDGRSGASLAPNVEGEALAIRRAYEMAGFSPAGVGLLEAHGTGTRAGDRAEMKAVQQVFSPGKKPESPWCALGSVKSMIGHTQAASGMAGLIKVAMALYNKTLPPTLNVSKANEQINWEESPCYLNTQTRPWSHDESGASPLRRAAVSAFGFGGVNAHAVLEECPELSAFAGQRKAEPLLSSSRGTVSLSLKYPTLDPQGLKNLARKAKSEDLSVKSAAVTAAGVTQRTSTSTGRVSLSNQSTQRDPAAEVLSSYLQTLGAFQKNLLGVQEKVMINYLNNEKESGE